MTKWLQIEGWSLGSSGAGEGAAPWCRPCCHGLLQGSPGCHSSPSAVPAHTQAAGVPEAGPVKTGKVQVFPGGSALANVLQGLCEQRELVLLALHPSPQIHPSAPTGMPPHSLLSPGRTKPRSTREAGTSCRRTSCSSEWRWEAIEGVPGKTLLQKPSEESSFPAVA